MWDVLLTECNAATMVGVAPYGAIRDAAIGIADGRLAYVGSRAGAGPAHTVRRLDGAWVTPGLVDCRASAKQLSSNATASKRKPSRIYSFLPKYGGCVCNSYREDCSFFLTAASKGEGSSE